MRLKVVRAYKGQGLTEYGFIGALILGVAVPAVVLLGANANELFYNFANSMGRNQTSAAPGPSIASVAGRNLPSVPGQVNSSSLGLASSDGLGMSASPGGQKMSFAPFDMEKQVQTTGANGTTEILLASMDTMIGDQLAAGEITQEQANALQRLSNMGHEMAALEKVVEQKYQEGIAAGKTGGQIIDETVVFNGQTYTVYDAYVILGSSESPNWGEGEVDRATLEKYKKMDSKDSLTLNFYDEYLKIQEQGLLSNPVTNQTVTYVSNQIAGLSEAVAEAMYTMKESPDKVPSKDEITHSASYTTKFQGTASETTDRHSATICTTGGGGDTGTNCR